MSAPAPMQAPPPGVPRLSGVLRVPREARAPAVRRTLIAILVLNLVVVFVKIAVGVRTGALTVLGAALESSLDALNNVVGMVLVSVADRGPDEDHPYGHDKFQTLGNLMIVGFLSISCFELLRESVSQLLRHEAPRVPGEFELALLASTALVNIGVVWYERKRGRELGSPFLLADAEHTNSDLYVTVLALSSLVASRLGWGVLDPLLALVVALLIAWTGFRILRGTVPILVDQRAVDPGQIRHLISGIPGILDVRSVRSRANASGVLFAEVTIEVDGGSSVADAHALADIVEARIRDQLGDSEVTIHIEPPA